MRSNHEVLTEALALARQRGDISWVNDAGVLVIFDPLPGDVDSRPCALAVLVQVEVDGKVTKCRSFLRDEAHSRVREVPARNSLAQRARQHVTLINHCMSVEARERHRADFAREFPPTGNQHGP